MMPAGMAVLLATLATADPPAEDISCGLPLGAAMSASSILGSAGRDATLGFLL
jgi:hypothetical protein